MSENCGLENLDFPFNNTRETKKFFDRPISTLPYIHSMGVSIFDPLHDTKPHSGEVCELIYVLAGNLKLVIGKNKFSAEQGDILMMPPRTIHLDEFDTAKGLKAFMVFFSWRGEKTFFEETDNNTLKNLPDQVKNEIARMLDAMRMDFTGEEDTDRLAACARLHTVLALSYRFSRMSRNNKKPDDGSGRRHRQKLFAGAKAWLEENYTRTVTLENIASALGVSAFYLSHVFSEESDFSLYAYLTALRMNKARELLGTGEKNVSEIARTVGYENSNSFTKAFRKHFGKPPRDFLYSQA